MSTIHAVVFDIGNVLIEWQPERFYDQVIGEAARRKMFAAIDLHMMNEVVDLGAPLHDTVYSHAQKYPEHANFLGGPSLQAALRSQKQDLGPWEYRVGYPSSGGEGPYRP